MEIWNTYGQGIWNNLTCTRFELWTVNVPSELFNIMSAMMSLKWLKTIKSMTWPAFEPKYVFFEALANTIENCPGFLCSLGQTVSLRTDQTLAPQLRSLTATSEERLNISWQCEKTCPLGCGKQSCNIVLSLHTRQREKKKWSKQPIS